MARSGHMCPALWWLSYLLLGLVQAFLNLLARGKRFLKSVSPYHLGKMHQHRG